jgi:CHASE2 domain-containing sensor protein/predicted Ser/Thr protein kinase
MNDLLKRYDILYTVVFFLLMILAERFEAFTLLEDETLGYRHLARWSMADVQATSFPQDKILFVNTDDKFYDDYGGFPLRRKDYGLLARNLKQLGAKVVAIDVLLDYRNSYGDDPEAAALFREAGNVLLVSTADIDSDGRRFLGMNYPLGMFRDVTRSGYSNIASASSVKTRLTRLTVFPEATAKTDGWPFAVQALSMYFGAAPKMEDGKLTIGSNVSVQLDAGTDFYIDFLKPARDNLYMSERGSTVLVDPLDVLGIATADPEDVRDLRDLVSGKIVLVGDTAEVSHDIFDTPVGPMWGVEVIANTISTLLRNGPLKPLPTWAEVLVSLTLLGLLLATTRIRAAPARVLVTILLLVGFWVVAFVAYGSAGIVMSMMYNTIAIIVGAALIFLRYFFASDENLVESERQSAESNRLLALAFQGQGQLDMAFDKFRAIPVDDRVADLIYNLALDFERKRQFSKAVSVYEYLRDWNANYRDIQQRIGRAAQIEANPMKGSMGGGTMASIVGGEGVEKPMLGRYEVQKELGQGAMGTVYLGEDPKIHRAVAIKTMSLAAEFEGDALADAKERFFREAESAGRLNHPNIVAIYDAGEEHDLAYIAMEFLKGKDLSKNTTADNLLPLEEVLDIGIQCAEALDYAHRMGVVHRDVKPSNMMYDRDTHTVKLTDFGIARITDSSKTRTGTVLGTPNYMSPEQALGDKVDGRSDLFSLGVVLYQLCAGRLPFQGDSMASLMYKIVNDPHPDIKDISATVPGSVRKVIDNALRKQPDKRYQSGAKLAEHLRVCKERLSSTRGSA